MKITLDHNQTFWALIHPETNQVLLLVNEDKPSAKIEIKELPDWAKEQIASSVQGKRVKIDCDIAELLSKEEEKVQEEPIKKIKKKAVVKKNIQS